MQLRGFIHTLLLSGVLVLPGAAQTTGSTGSSQSTTGSQSGTTTPTTDRQTTGSHTGHTAGAAGDSGPAVGKTDHDFMTKAAHSSTMEVQVAQMAQQKAANDQVKEYARKLEADHKKANEQLMQIAQQRGVQLPAGMGQHDAQMQKLSNLSGEEFDRAFMRMQVQHHKKDVKEFQRHANRSMDSAVKEFASAQLPVLQEHLRQAEQLAAETGTRGRKADKNTTKSSGSDSTGSSSQEGQGTGSRDKNKPSDQKEK